MGAGRVIGAGTCGVSLRGIASAGASFIGVRSSPGRSLWPDGDRSPGLA
jgi:hypothetical protein